MPKRCLWETIHFMMRFQFSKAFRRWTNKGVQNDPDIAAKTWYYQPRLIAKWARSSFRVVRTMPVGIVVPPGYLERFFMRRKRTLFKLYSLEKKLSHFSFLSGFSDHYIIDLQLKSVGSNR